MKFTPTTLDAAVCDVTDLSVLYRVRIEGYLFQLPDTKLDLVVHKVIERKTRTGPFRLSEKRWMVSEPRTGLRVLHEREYLTRADAVDAASETINTIGMATTMEKIMLAMAGGTEARVQSLGGANI